MSRAAVDLRESELRAAGLTLLDVIPSASGIGPVRAWMPVIHGEAVPTAVVNYCVDDVIGEVNRQWWRLAESHGILAADGSFLISFSGKGAFALRWAVVRATYGSPFMAALPRSPGDPEFVTMARDGHAVLGVTLEEYGMWLVVAHPKSGQGVVRPSCFVKPGR